MHVLSISYSFQSLFVIFPLLVITFRCFISFVLHSFWIIRICSIYYFDITRAKHVIKCRKNRLFIRNKSKLKLVYCLGVCVQCCSTVTQFSSLKLGTHTVFDPHTLADLSLFTLHTKQSSVPNGPADWPGLGPTGAEPARPGIVAKDLQTIS